MAFDSEVTAIRPWAFKEEVILNTIVLPDSIMEIGDCAFEGCRNLTEVKIGKNVSVIGNRAFIWCESLKNINPMSGGLCLTVLHIF